MNSDMVLFWHLTAFTNMQSILVNGLWSRNKLIESKLVFDDKSPVDLTKKREKLGLNKYVPFHFIPWNPLDIALLKQRKKDERFCFITIHQDLAKKLKYKIILEYPNHKEELYFLEYNKCKSAIDKRRRNTDYSNGKQKLEALGECLVPDCVEVNNFHSIIVETEDDKKTIENMIQNNLISKISVNQGYFNVI